jgi:hypothetical protein
MFGNLAVRAAKGMARLTQIENISWAEHMKLVAEATLQQEKLLSTALERCNLICNFLAEAAT